MHREGKRKDIPATINPQQKLSTSLTPHYPQEEECKDKNKLRYGFWAPNNKAKNQSTALESELLPTASYIDCLKLAYAQTLDDETIRPGV